MGEQIDTTTVLVNRLKDGDQDALVQLMSVYQSEVLTHAIRTVKDWMLAEEVVSDTFAKLWRFADTVKPETLRPWLYRVCHNTCIDRLRRLKNRGDVSLETILPSDQPLYQAYCAIVTQPGQILNRLAMAQLQELVMSQLPDAYRDCLIRRMDDQEYRVIAEQLGIPMGTVKSRVNYAQQRARKLALDAGWDLKTLTWDEAV